MKTSTLIKRKLQELDLSKPTTTPIHEDIAKVIWEYLKIDLDEADQANVIKNLQIYWINEKNRIIEQHYNQINRLNKQCQDFGDSINEILNT